MKILIATGGSAGHIFPALAVARELKAAGHEVFFSGVFADFGKTVMAQGYDFKELSAKGLTSSGLHPRKIPEFLISCIYMLKSLRESDILLKKYQPDVVVGFGGYGAFPVVVMARIAKCPTMIHEQNVSPGRANRLLAKGKIRVALSFETSQKYFAPSQTVLTGYPLYHAKKSTQDKLSARRAFSLKEDLYTLFVVGGSQGSHRINTVFSDSIPLLKKQMAFQVIHSCGKKDFVSLKEAYLRHGIPFYLKPFVGDVDGAYQACDLVVARAGAGTVMEIDAYGVSAIVIPYPHAQGHQRRNADELARCARVEIVDDTDVTPEILTERIIAQADVNRLPPDMPESGIFVADAAERLAREIVGLKK